MKLNFNEIQNLTSLDNCYLTPENEIYQPTSCLEKIWYRLKEAIHDLFSETSSRKTLEGKIVEVLIQETDTKAAEKAEKLGLKALFDCKQDTFAEKATFAWKAQRFKRAGGATSSAYFLLDEAGKEFAVFKTEDKQPTFTKIKQCVKSVFGQRSYMDPGTRESKIEVLAYKLAQELGLDCVPYTEEFAVDGCKGFLQEYVAGQSLDTWLTEEKTTFTEREQTIAQKFFIYDFLLGNLDRHRENWLVNVNEKGELTKIFAIDNGNSFPVRGHSKTSDWMHPPVNQYLWAEEHKISHFPITKEVGGWIESKITNLDVSKLGLTLEMQGMLSRRKDVLLMLYQKEDWRPNDLRNYRYEENITALLPVKYGD